MKEYFGIDIGGTAVKWAVLTEDYRVVERGSLPTAFESADEVVAVLADLVRPYVGRVSAVGVSAPGGIYEGDPDGTIHRGGALLYMDGCPLGRRLREELGLPVAVNNDGKCCALGEYAAGALRGVRTGVVLAVGTAIGGGIVLDGHVLRGAHCFAGEFSFLRNSIDESEGGMPPTFAISGGWRSLAGLVCEEKGIELTDDIDGRVVFDWVEAGDKAALRGLSRYALLFDQWLANLQAVLDPEVFVIAGGISRRPELMAALRAQMPAAIAPFEAFGGMPEPQVKAAEMGNDANLAGAVMEAIRLAG
ncbi:ROK family protein [Paratractidigestivibacter sp.]|uniref:ROK family protein n=1 Tax=Paratractidigestivibacter sp. TaxID=2847316 RepID=UPI002ABD3AE2|nr:ROK family protein [Paratractidigestivibacter sp.]